MEDNEVYAKIGEEGFRRLVAAFYQQIPHDDILGPMYPADDLEGAEQRLRDFLIFRFGGGTAYLERRGHPRLRMRHAPFAVTPAASQRWIQIMSRALEQADLPADAAAVLRAFFESTAAFLQNRPNHPFDLVE